MIAVVIDHEGFEYDIHSLVKAFYPGSEVKVYRKGTREIRSDAELPEIQILRTDREAEIRVCAGEKREIAESGKTGIPEGADRSQIKNRLKQVLYQVLLNYTGQKLPWGSLTGIRPTKIAMGLLEQGRSEEEITAYMQEAYFASEEKSRLSATIARLEKRILSGISRHKGYSLYIGIPFCPTTCLYCSFTSFPICAWKDRVEDYLEALFRELSFTAELYRDRILDSVYIGGGTPTTLEPEQLEKLIEKIKSEFNFKNVMELTVEAGRPDSITDEKLQVLQNGGVTRISINPQTMNPETLKRIGRQHTVEQVIEAFHAARRRRFTNINMDLILGLPGEEETDVIHTLEEVKKLDPDSLTVHSLAVKRASRLSRWILENGMETIHNTDSMMKHAAQAAESMEMRPYYLYRQKNMSGNFENVGYAREGCYGLYNILMMEEVQTIVALGAGSITKRVYPDGTIKRCENVKEVAQYIERIDEMIERKRVLFSD